MNANLRKFCRWIHRDLSFLFSGMLLVYAISGIALNHKDTYNSQYSIERQTFQVEKELLSDGEITPNTVLAILQPLGEEANYTQHYFPESNRMKVFLKGGSSLTVDTESGVAVYESVRKRPLWSALNRLHYNPGRWWTLFSDIFAFSLIVITLTGVIMLKGPKGLWGRGGVEMLAGILVPVLFLMLM